MVGLLVSVELALERLALQEPGDRLVDVVPDLPSSERLNRSIGETRSVLDTSERHMAYMAIPYVLSIHQRGLADALEVLQKEGAPVAVRKEPDVAVGGGDWRAAQPHDIPLASIHDSFAHALELDAEEVFPPAVLSAFEFVRFIRNRLTHHRGIAGSKLSGAWAQAGKRPDANGCALWEAHSKRSFPLVGARESLQLGSRELFATLALCKSLADAAEQRLLAWLPPSALADIVVADYQEQFPHRAADDARLARRLGGFCNREYQAFGLSDSDLIAAADRMRLRRW